jgi:hypothetical protein
MKIKPEVQRMMAITDFLCWVETNVKGAKWGEYPRHLYVGESYIGGALEEYPEWFIADVSCDGDMTMIHKLKEQYIRAGSPDGYCCAGEVFSLPCDLDDFNDVLFEHIDIEELNYEQR